MKKVEKQVIAKVKSMQRLEAGDREAENKRAFSKFAKDHLTKGQVEAPHTQRYGECGSVGVGEEGENFLTFVLRQDLSHNPI